MGKNLGSLLFAAILVAVLALPVTAGAAPSNAQQDGKVVIESNAWSNYHWARTVNSFTLSLGNNVTSDWSSYLSTASVDWNRSTVHRNLDAPSSWGKLVSSSKDGRYSVYVHDFGNGQKVITNVVWAD